MKFLRVILLTGLMAACHHDKPYTPANVGKIKQVTEQAHTSVTNAKTEVANTGSSIAKSKELVDKLKVDEANKTLIGQLKLQLNIAADENIKAALELDRTIFLLNTTVAEADGLQLKIDEQVQELDKAVKEKKYWEAKHQEALDKLWYWRRLAIVIVAIITTYVGLKFYFKFPL